MADLNNSDVGSGLLLLSLVSKQQSDIERLQEQVAKLEQRNIDKDVGKSFESSWTRTCFIIAFTYIVIYLYLRFSLNVADPQKNAVVPAIGFTMSTWSMSLVKPVWARLTQKGDDFRLKRDKKDANSVSVPPAPPLPLC